MKSTVSLLVCALSISLAEADLVSYWPLDETDGEVAADSVGTNDAVWQNAGLNLTWIEGRVGNAAKLADVGGAGANNYFQFNLPELIGAQAITIAAWVDPEAQGSSGYNGIVMTRTFNGASGNSWGLAIENNGDERFDSRVNGPGIDSPNGLLSPNNGWVHIALVWDGTAGTHTQYVDGVQTNTGGSISGPIAGPDSGPWYIGYDDCCGNTRDFDGAIDEVAFWDEALDSIAIGLLAGGARPDLLDAADTDGDGIPDDYEDMFGFLDPNEDGDAALDQDDDGLSNLEEFTRDTDPEDPDTDGDSLTDGDEVEIHSTNPKAADTDGDELNDDEELVAGADGFVTDPLLVDTDEDGFDDGEEIANGTDPTDSNDPPPAAPMLIGHWPMDEDAGLVAVDRASGNDGTWQNADGSNLVWTAGQIGGAAQLADLGGDSFFQIDTIPQLINSNALTIALWIEPDENPGYNGIFMTRTLDGQTNNSWGVALDNTGGSPNHLDTRVDKAGIDAPADSLSPDGGWFHVAMVWDGATGTHTQYINGAETANTANSLNRQIQSTSGPWYIGYDDCCGGGRDFSGLIDDVGMWNQALTAAEIAQIYDNGLSGSGIGGPGVLFQITEIVLNGDGSVDLTWTSDPREGVTYSVLFSPDMIDPISGWADVDDGVPSGGESTTFNVSTGTIGGAERLFFVVRRN